MWRRTLCVYTFCNLILLTKCVSPQEFYHAPLDSSTSEICFSKYTLSVKKTRQACLLVMSAPAAAQVPAPRVSSHPRGRCRPSSLPSPAAFAALPPISAAGLQASSHSKLWDPQLCSLPALGPAALLPARTRWRAPPRPVGLRSLPLSGERDTEPRMPPWQNFFLLLATDMENGRLESAVSCLFRRPGCLRSCEREQRV